MDTTITKKLVIDSILEDFDREAESFHDRALSCLLLAFKDKLPEPDHYFHKCFRQCDVIEAGNGGYVDMAIWNLLNSNLFWEIFGRYVSEEENPSF